MIEYDQYLLNLLSSNYLKKVGCRNRDSYLSHLHDLYSFLERWKVTQNVCLETVKNLVQYHGFDRNDLPEHLKSNKDFIRLHDQERVLFKIHEKLIAELGLDPDLKPLQVELDHVRHTDRIVLFILLADSISILCQSEDLAREDERLRSIARVFLEIYQRKALEQGIYFDTRQASDNAFKYVNRPMHELLKYKIAQSKPTGSFLCKQLTDRLRNSGIVDPDFGNTKIEFQLRSISSIAKGLGVLFDDIPDLVTISRLSDVGRIRVDCHNRKHLFQVLQFVLTTFPSREIRLSDYLELPKRSGYRGLHVGTELWLDYNNCEGKIITDIDGVGAEYERLSFMLVLPEGGGILDGLDRVIRDLAELSSTRNGLKIKTPKHDIKELPAGASVADFAFAVHSGLGLCCKGAEVTSSDGEIRNVGPEHKLADGDTVDINRADNPDFSGPTATWLNFCVTRGARSKITQYIRAAKELRRFNHIVNITILAVDDKGLTTSVAELISKRDLYAFRFEGQVLNDGRAQFTIQLLMTKDEKMFLIDKKELIRAFESLPHFLSIHYHVSDISDFGTELMSMGMDGKYDNTMRDSAYFVGRGDEGDKLSAWYRTGELVFFLCGFYRAGKTLLVSHFISELPEKVYNIYIGFNLCPSCDEKSLFMWLVRELHKQCLGILGWAPEVTFGNNEDDNTIRLCDYIVEIVFWADCNNKKVLFVFDDVDAIELKSEGTHRYLFQLFRQLKSIKDGSIDRTSDIKIVVIGQYILYRNLRDRPPEDIHFGRLNLTRLLKRQDSIRYVSRRFRGMSGSKPELNYLNNLEKSQEVVVKIGYNPNNLAIAMNSFSYKIQSSDDGNTSRNSLFTSVLQDVYDELLGVNYSSQVFGQLKSHYLAPKRNPHVFMIMKYFAYELNVGGGTRCRISHSEIIKYLGNQPEVTLALLELSDFGFIDKKTQGNETNYLIYRDITWDYLIMHFAETQYL